MIKVDIFRDSHKECRGFRLTGHAGYGEEGEDIVCAAVSAITFNTVNSIEEFTEDPFTCDAGEDGGYLEFHFSDTISDESTLLVRSMILGLQGIERDYGTQYIRIRYEEV